MTKQSSHSQLDPNRLVGAHEAASLYGMSRSWLYAEIAAGRIPKPYKIGSRSRWRWSELLADTEARTAESSVAPDRN